MEQLRQSDLEALLDFVRNCYAIHEPEPFEDFVRRLVDALPRLIPAAHVTYNEMYPHRSESRNCVNTAELATPAAASLWEQHMIEHPVLLRVLETDDRRALRISDFWSRRRLRDSGLHHDFYRHYDIADALCITVPCRPPRVIGVGWHDDRLFTDRERLIADLVRPHISQAWQNARLVDRLRRRLQTLPEEMNGTGVGVIACTPGGRIRFVDPSAQRLLAEYFEASRQAGHRLPEQLLRWVRHQNAKLSGNDVPPVRSPLVHEKGTKRLVIRLLSQPGANLLLLEEQRAVPDTSVLERFDLTRREADVLARIAQGRTNNEIAIILQVSVGTVKKHIEHILAKLGVETRTAAAALAWEADPLRQAP